MFLLCFLINCIKLIKETAAHTDGSDDFRKTDDERDLKELQRHQKEIDTYLGKKHEDI